MSYQSEYASIPFSRVDGLGNGKDGKIFLFPSFWGQDIFDKERIPLGDGTSAYTTKVYQGKKSAQERAVTILHEISHLARDPNYDSDLHSNEVGAEFPNNVEANAGIAATCGITIPSVPEYDLERCEGVNPDSVSTCPP